MTRNVNLPNFTTTEDPEYRYRAGRVKDSNIYIRSSEGFLEYLPGAASGMIASVVIRTRGRELPEIPSPAFISMIGWEYYETIQHPNSTRYKFLLDDSEAEKLRDVVFYLDTLYG